MRRARNAKIIATLGPSSNDLGRITKLFEAGADVFRLNFSHGTHEDHRRRYEIVREVEKAHDRPIGVLMDLQGPKLRVGQFDGGQVELRDGERFVLDMDAAPGTRQRVSLPHPEIFQALKSGMDLLLDDGRIRLRVVDCSDDRAETEVITGGILSDRKGVNVPGAILPLSPLTAKDHADLSFGLDLGVDWVALSFVQRPEDVAEARKLVAGRASIMAKLEKPAAFDRLDEIIELADAVMVARGDLGVELPPENVPSLQKRIVRACRKAGKPVVVATQMLESMVHAPTPTRAEASDVATAIYEGADAVMLSAETASGKYAVDALTMMNRIVTQVERDPNFRQIMDAEHPDPQATANDAITAAARQVAHTVSASAIATYTNSGSTTLRAARERPSVPILSLTPSIGTARRLTLAWGVHGVVTPDVTSVEEMVERATTSASTEGFGGAGDRVVITAGMPFGTPGATNLLRIAWIDG
ncbi:MAG: pyruvate kinase [Alphaproteobacteria bacterium]|nr:pyruvate kinase [Alphaproteobacteria bacterium]